MVALFPALRADVAGAYRVCLETGASGTDASGIYSDPDLLGHVYVGPYLAAQRCFATVVVDEAGVAGYVLGALDTRAFELWCEAHWWPALRGRYPLGTASGPDAELVQHIHHPPEVPDATVERYPSHLHIDLVPRAQGRGLGRTLIETLRRQLIESGSRGVHLVVGAENTRAVSFYAHIGFEQIDDSPGGITMGLRLPRVVGSGRCP